MAATSILDSDWLIYKKSSILKLHGQLESIFAGMMLEGHLQKKHYPTKNTADTGSLVSDWPIYKKMFSSETTLPVGTKHYMNDAKMVFYKNSSFYFDQTKTCSNKAFLFLIGQYTCTKKIFPLLL